MNRNVQHIVYGFTVLCMTVLFVCLFVVVFVVKWAKNKLTLQCAVVTVCTARFSISVLPTQYARVFCVDLRTNSDYFTVQHWLVGFYNWDGVCLLCGTFCPHSMLVCFVWIWEQTAIISLYSIDWLVFITETECVYCAVRSAHTVCSCVLCGSENKQRLFHCTALTGWFL